MVNRDHVKEQKSNMLVESTVCVNVFYSPAAICRPAETGGSKNVKPAIKATTRARHRKMRAALPTAKIQYYNHNQRT